MSSAFQPSDDLETKIAFQGELGAYSHMAANELVPHAKVLPKPSFEDALAAVKYGDADLAMIPIENSIAGRVADIHMLLPGSGLFIIAEHFSRVSHCLLVPKGATLGGIKQVTSHLQALGQCRETLRKMGVEVTAYADTAGAARHVAERGDPGLAALASQLAAHVYGLDIARKEMEDHGHNTTRFILLSREPRRYKPEDGDLMTSLTFETRNIPAALFKALGGFATNGVNLTKLESYYEGDSFRASEFYVDIVGHPEEEALARALDELRFHAKRVRILGTYRQARKRA